MDQSMLSQDQINILTLDKIDDYLTKHGFPENNNTFIERIENLLQSVKPNQSMLDLQIRHDALVGRLIPYMAIGEQDCSETLSRLIRYIQQLERNINELRQMQNK